MVSDIFTWSIGLKKFLKKHHANFGQNSICGISAKSGKVNFEKCDCSRSRLEIFKTVSNSLKITTSLWAYWSFIFKWFDLSEMNRPDWIIKNDGSFRFKSEWWCPRVSYGYQKGIPRVLRKLFFQSWQMHFDFFFQAFISNFFSETSKSSCFEVRKHSKTLLDETTQRRLLLKKKWKVFSPSKRQKR